MTTDLPVWNSVRVDSCLRGMLVTERFYRVVCGLRAAVNQSCFKPMRKMVPSFSDST